MPRYFSAIISSFDKPFRFAKAPIRPGSLVHQFGERFGQAIGDRLHHDRFVVVQLGLEFGGQLVRTDAGGDDEPTDVIFPATIDRSDVIGQRTIILLSLAFPLLAQAVES